MVERVRFDNKAHEALQLTMNLGGVPYNDIPLIYIQSPIPYLISAVLLWF